MREVLVLATAMTFGATGLVHAQLPSAPTDGSTGPTVPDTRPVDQRLPNAPTSVGTLPSNPSNPSNPSTPPSPSAPPPKSPAEKR